MAKTGYFKQDDSGHWYLIPKNKVERFCELLDEINSYESWEIRDALCEGFMDEFDQYRLSGGIENYEVTIDG